MSELELTMMRRVGELNKEVARLKAEVERLRHLDRLPRREVLALQHFQDSLLYIRAGYSLTFIPTFKELLEKVADQKAEVERLTEAWVDKKMQEDRDALLQQVERLTKAGDAMEVLACFHYDHGDISKDKHSVAILDAWNAAKEGKGQS